jgi:hypothetical protein
MNSTDMIDAVDRLYKAENVAQLLCHVADGLTNQPKLAAALSEAANSLVDIISSTRNDLEGQIEAQAEACNAA